MPRADASEEGRAASPERAEKPATSAAASGRPRPAPGELAPLAGLAFAVLFGIGNSLWFFDAPEFAADADEIAEFYFVHSGEVIAGATMSLVGIAFFCVFAGVVHRALTRADGRNGWLPAVALAGAIAAIAAGLGAEAINAAGAIRANEDAGIAPQAAQVYFDISQMLGFPAAAVGSAVFGAAVAAVALRTGTILPRWFALLTLLFAVLLLTPFSFFGIALLAPWVAIVSLILYAAERKRASAAS